MAYRRIEPLARRMVIRALLSGDYDSQYDIADNCGVSQKTVSVYKMALEDVMGEDIFEGLDRDEVQVIEKTRMPSVNAVNPDDVVEGADFQAVVTDFSNRDGTPIANIGGLVTFVHPGPGTDSEGMSYGDVVSVRISRRGQNYAHAALLDVVKPAKENRA